MTGILERLRQLRRLLSKPVVLLVGVLLAGGLMIISEWITTSQLYVAGWEVLFSVALGRALAARIGPPGR